MTAIDTMQNVIAGLSELERLVADLEAAERDLRAAIQTEKDADEASAVAINALTRAWQALNDARGRRRECADALTQHITEGVS